MSFPFQRIIAALLCTALFLVGLPMPASAFTRTDDDSRARPGTTIELGLSAPADDIVDGGRLCGEQFDSALGLYYLRARYMNASSGRFWNADSYGGSTSEPRSLHKYLYGEGDPVGMIDPSGYSSLVEQLGITKTQALLVAIGGVATLAARDATLVNATSLFIRDLTERFQSLPTAQSVAGAATAATADEVIEGTESEVVTKALERTRKWNYPVLFLHGTSYGRWPGLTGALADISINLIGKGYFGLGFYTFPANPEGMRGAVNWADGRAMGDGGVILVVGTSSDKWNEMRKVNVAPGSVEHEALVPGADVVIGPLPVDWAWATTEQVYKFQSGAKDLTPVGVIPFKIK